MNTQPQTTILNTAGVEVFIVGGYVRDRILGLDAKDHDFVVTGGSTQMMLNAGFQPVGADFPVFLAPNGDEWALARTERKVGTGYNGFETDFSPTTTIEEDLGRRDLTINAMARRVLSFNGFGHAKLSDEIVDPWGGKQDLLAGVISATTMAFGEDPLRVLRAARFAARFNFTITDTTRAMMKQLVQDGEMENLTPERVCVETEKAMTEKFPDRFWNELNMCGALGRLFPAFRIVGPSTFRALNGVVPELRLPLMSARVIREELAAMLERLKFPVDTAKACLHTNNVQRWLGFGPSLWTADGAELVEIFHSIDAFRNPGILLNVIVPVIICQGFRNTGLQLEDAFHVASSITFASLTEDEQKTLKGPEISKRIRQLRVNAVEKVL